MLPSRPGRAAAGAHPKGDGSGSGSCASCPASVSISLDSSTVSAGLRRAQAVGNSLRGWLVGTGRRASWVGVGLVSGAYAAQGLDHGAQLTAPGSAAASCAAARIA